MAKSFTIKDTLTASLRFNKGDLHSENELIGGGNGNHYKGKDKGGYWQLPKLGMGIKFYYIGGKNPLGWIWKPKAQPGHTYSPKGHYQSPVRYYSPNKGNYQSPVRYYSPNKGNYQSPVRYYSPHHQYKHIHTGEGNQGQSLNFPKEYSYTPSNHHHKSNNHDHESDEQLSNPQLGDDEVKNSYVQSSGHGSNDVDPDEVQDQEDHHHHNDIGHDPKPNSQGEAVRDNNDDPDEVQDHEDHHHHNDIGHDPKPNSQGGAVSYNNDEPDEVQDHEDHHHHNDIGHDPKPNSQGGAVSYNNVDSEDDQKPPRIFRNFGRNSESPFLPPWRPMPSSNSVDDDVPPTINYLSPPPPRPTASKSCPHLDCVTFLDNESATKQYGDESSTAASTIPRHALRIKKEDADDKLLSTLKLVLALARTTNKKESNKSKLLSKLKDNAAPFSNKAESIRTFKRAINSKEINGQKPYKAIKSNVGGGINKLKLTHSSVETVESDLENLIDLVLKRRKSSV
jgi:hypothetical protein